MEYQRDVEQANMLFIVSAYLIVFKDSIRVVEHLFNIPFPLATINATILLVLTGQNCFALTRRRQVTFAPCLMAAITVLQFGIVVYHILLSGSADLRDIAGVAIVQLAVPLAIISSAMRFDLLGFVIVSRHVRIISALVFLFALLEAIWAHVRPLSIAGFLMDLYHNNLVSYPLQTTVSSYYIRINGPFYSAFSMSLFLVYCIVATVSYRKFRIGSIIIILLALFIMWMTINRNGMLVLAFDLFALLAINLWPKVKTPSYSVMVCAIFGSLAIPFFGSFIGSAAYDNSALFKLSTLSSRVETWRQILHGSWTDLMLGTGFVQGLGEQGVNTFMVDNFLLYTAYQAGILIAITMMSLIIYILYKAAGASLGGNSASGSFVILAGGVVAFGLNIAYFEPIFQLLYLGPALSVAAGATRWRSDDNPLIVSPSSDN